MFCHEHCWLFYFEALQRRTERSRLGKCAPIGAHAMHACIANERELPKSAFYPVQNSGAATILR
jgi:hypothetical protein